MLEEDNSLQKVRQFFTFSRQNLWLRAKIDAPTPWFYVFPDRFPRHCRICGRIEYPWKEQELISVIGEVKVNARNNYWIHTDPLIMITPFEDRGFSCEIVNICLFHATPGRRELYDCNTGLPHLLFPPPPRWVIGVHNGWYWVLAGLRFVTFTIQWGLSRLLGLVPLMLSLLAEVLWRIVARIA